MLRFGRSDANEVRSNGSSFPAPANDVVECTLAASYSRPHPPPPWLYWRNLYVGMAADAEREMPAERAMRQERIILENAVCS